MNIAFKDVIINFLYELHSKYPMHKSYLWVDSNNDVFKENPAILSNIPLCYLQKRFKIKNLSQFNDIAYNFSIIYHDVCFNITSMITYDWVHDFYKLNPSNDIIMDYEGHITNVKNIHE